MNKISYPKIPLSFTQQVEQLKSRGLIIEDENFCHSLLNHISYYRLSAYMYPLLKDKKNHIFKSGTKFGDILSLYNFDRELRLLLFDAIERIEISLRTNIIYILSHKHGPFCIGDENLFYDKDSFNKHISKLKDELYRSNEVFLEHYFSKYLEKIPPAWISFEIASFGLLSMFYKNLKFRKDQKDIAECYDLNFVVFSSWLHSLTYVRNVCAHHSRLWNRELAIRPALPQSQIKSWLNLRTDLKNDRIFIILAITAYFLNIIYPPNNFGKDLKGLLNKYPMVDTDAMGFTKNWKEDGLFN